MVLDAMFFGNSLKNYLIALAIILLSIAVGHIFSKVIVKIIKKIAAKTETLLDDILINVLEKPFIFTLFVVGIYLIQFYVTFSPRGHEIYLNVLEVLIVLNITWIVIRLTDAVIEHYLTPLVKNSESELDDHLLPFAKNVVRVLIVIIALIFLIRHFGYDVTSLVAGLGIGGLAFALAAQPLLSNLFGGLSIIADQPFHIGDRVTIDQKFTGIVKEIGMRSTRIVTPNNTLLTVPNNVIATTVVENHSDNKDHAARITFDIGLVYSTPNAKVEEALAIIKTILTENEYILKGSDDVDPVVVFNKFTDSTLNIYVAYSFKATPATGNLRTLVNLEIKKRLENAGIEFAFPTQTVHVKKE